MSRSARIKNKEIVDAYALTLVRRGKSDHVFQILITTGAGVGEWVRLEPYGVEVLVRADLATHEQPAIAMAARDWLRLRGVLCDE